MLAARKIASTRCSTGTRFQVSKYSCADSIACFACSALACCTTPTTCDGCDGFVDFNFSAVLTSCPAMTIGYSRANSEATFFSAACIAARFSAFVKSTNGSFTNSGFCNRVSAVAMSLPPDISKHPILLRASFTRQRFHSNDRLPTTLPCHYIKSSSTASLKIRVCRSTSASVVAGHISAML